MDSVYNIKTQKTKESIQIYCNQLLINFFHT